MRKNTTMQQSRAAVILGLVTEAKADTNKAGMIIGQAKGKFKRMPKGGVQIDGDKESLVLLPDGTWSIEV